MNMEHMAKTTMTEWPLVYSSTCRLYLILCIQASTVSYELLAVLLSRSVPAQTIDQRCPRFLFPTSVWLRNGSVPSARWTFLSAAVCTLPRHTTRESEQDQSPLVLSARQRVRKKLRPQRQESTKRQWPWIKYKKQHWAERNLRVFNKVWVRNMFVAWKLNFSSTSLLRSSEYSNRS